MINCHRFNGLESHNTHLYVLALRAGQVSCPAETLAAFHNRGVATNVHARCPEQRKDVSTHFPEAALGRKGGKVSCDELLCDELLCLSFFLFPVPSRCACADLGVPTGLFFFSSFLL